MFAAILGAHTLGSAKAENSGYEGTWSETPGAFNNDYFRQMITRGWGPDRAVNGNEERNQWKIVDSDPTDGLMLNSDLCLAYDNNAKHQTCMAENNFNNRRCKNYKIRASQSMPWRPNAVLGLIKELSSTREYSVSRKAKARFVVKKSPQEVNNLDLRL